MPAPTDDPAPVLVTPLVTPLNPRGSRQPSVHPPAASSPAPAPPPAAADQVRDVCTRVVASLRLFASGDKCGALQSLDELTLLLANDDVDFRTTLLEHMEPVYVAIALYFAQELRGRPDFSFAELSELADECVPNALTQVMEKIKEGPLPPGTSVFGLIEDACCRHINFRHQRLGEKRKRASAQAARDRTRLPLPRPEIRAGRLACPGDGG